MLANTNPKESSPAESRPHLPWPLWRRILTYAILITAAAIAIKLVDRKAQQDLTLKSETSNLE